MCQVGGLWLLHAGDGHLDCAYETEKIADTKTVVTSETHVHKLFTSFSLQRRQGVPDQAPWAPSVPVNVYAVEQVVFNTRT